jgi:hypothetical protein
MPNFFQQMGQNWVKNWNAGKYQSPEQQRIDLERERLGLGKEELGLKKEGLGLERQKLGEVSRHQQATETTAAGEVKRKADEDKWQKITNAFKSATDVLQHTESADAANSVLKAFFKDDPNPPINGVQYDTKNKLMKFDLDDGIFTINQPDWQQLMEAVKGGADIREAMQTAHQSGVGIFMPKGAKPKTEHEAAVEGQKETELGLKAREVTVKEKKERRETGGKPTGWKEKKIAELWETLTDDEKKRVIGARLDPHELTEKNILDVYGNIMTDPSVKKALQPIAEKIISRTINKGTEPTANYDSELKAAKDAIGQGRSKEEVKKMFKKRTGKDYPE